MAVPASKLYPLVEEYNIEYLEANRIECNARLVFDFVSAQDYIKELEKEKIKNLEIKAQLDFLKRVIDKYGIDLKNAMFDGK